MNFGQDVHLTGNRGGVSSHTHWENTGTSGCLTSMKAVNARAPGLLEVEEGLLELILDIGQLELQDLVDLSASCRQLRHFCSRERVWAGFARSKGYADPGNQMKAMPGGWKAWRSLCCALDPVHTVNLSSFPAHRVAEAMKNSQLRAFLDDGFQCVAIELDYKHISHLSEEPEEAGHEVTPAYVATKEVSPGPGIKTRGQIIIHAPPISTICWVIAMRCHVSLVEGLMLPALIRPSSRFGETSGCCT